MSNTTALLDVWENLVIRACKSTIGNPILRIKKILARRSALYLEDVSEDWMLQFLLQIIEKYNLCGLVQFHEKFFETKRWNNYKIFHPKIDSGPKKTDVELLIETAISVLTFTESKKFPNYHPPLYWRLQEKT